MSKTLRQFECRDDVWERVATLAQRRGISTDEVVSAALLQLFARKKTSTSVDLESSSPRIEEGTPAPRRAPEPDAAEVAPPKAAAAPPAAPVKPPLPRTPSIAPPAAPPAVPPAAAPAAAPAPPLPRPRPATLPAPPGASSPSLPRPPAQASRGLPPPPGGARLPAPPARAATAPAPPLYLWCEGEWYTIDQDQYVIGRGAKYADLAIKDANISRRHCSIVRRNGAYYVKDLGSTNGVEFNGERVDNHRIDEGSLYLLCDHELRFTFQNPF